MSQDQQETVFHIPKMDCPSEERLVRMALDKSAKISAIKFDLSARTLTVTHADSTENLLLLLEPLKYGAKELTSRQVSAASADSGSLQSSDETERKTLYWLLAINGTMFVVELGFGLFAQSTGLIADSLDMLADALVYGISLYAVGKAAAAKDNAARVSGWLQMALAVGCLIEVGRRFFYGGEPVSTLMISVSAVALLANVFCLWLISKHRHGGNHMKASWIFSSNDVLVNLGVIVSGVLVGLTGSHYPDLVIGLLISLLVASGAIRILRLSRS
jgi:Co/Zn/Cd efflux system component